MSIFGKSHVAAGAFLAVIAVLGVAPSAHADPGTLYPAVTAATSLDAQTLGIAEGVACSAAMTFDFRADSSA
ncbi:MULTISPECIES: hypothetical protein [Streptomyces]|uniref:hypothetical protein n=1 Tax=Streptomyces TaxID=1883 RepID=UPI00163BB65C|nr:MULTISPECIES: hypothetical protein [Streptomyces]MBC2878045.1 hypothetical protein [Streptomyces sp. TYQ1024]UBI39999.1 hypothetical protein K7I03_28385 [Streptomyces mobaraensis]UKW32580.1 hypothetical protein MCU78_28315 [Streptomyces sp. TYQ1024]